MIFLCVQSAAWPIAAITITVTVALTIQAWIGTRR